ncbi:hypothetical protein HUF18_14385 [Thalassolituus sp. ST750PaO-4]|uniref:hypothetical protein n=1 Tax=Thalassolituus sp. ST750PaO-4 TaxID=2742965 RepID=UPI000C619681|nr:hypothetical protein [Thalassolituus sp. ST750PaO-4]MCA6060966.1 hypothetical protein [Thalassolituus sp. ST750PaO-4]PIQ38978.1 MAG: hypothetical protein COW58_14330 [Thalassolituus sp. CG17_big_fil_post_rev_8_21_14_2_50_53_8]
MSKYKDILLKPNLTPVNEVAARYRKRLVSISVVLLLLSTASSGINSGSSFLGVRFDGLDVEAIETFFWFTTLYFLLAFFLEAIDDFRECSLRLTGVAIPMVSNGSFLADVESLAPGVDDFRQSTIFSWWAVSKERMESASTSLHDLMNAAQPSGGELNDLRQRVNAALANIATITNGHEYLQESVRRMELGFWELQRGRLIRWIAFEMLFPVVLALVSLILMGAKLWL